MDQMLTVAAVNSLAMFPVCARMSQDMPGIDNKRGILNVRVIYKRGELASMEVQSNMTVGHGCHLCLSYP